VKVPASQVFSHPFVSFSSPHFLSSLLSQIQLWDLGSTVSSQMASQAKLQLTLVHFMLLGTTDCKPGCLYVKLGFLFRGVHTGIFGFRFWF